MFFFSDPNSKWSELDQRLKGDHHRWQTRAVFYWQYY